MVKKSTMRSLGAAVRQADQAAQKRRREQERQRQQREKMQEQERAAHEVRLYEERIDALLSIHKDCSSRFDWEALRSAEPPEKPTRGSTHEEAAQAQLSEFKAGVFDRLLKRTESKQADLIKATEEAKQEDERNYQDALQLYEQKYSDWKCGRDLAEGVLQGNTESYVDAVDQMRPFRGIGAFGTYVDFRAESSQLVVATLQVNSERAIPSEVKSLLKSGKVSVKQMPKGRFYELYQGYVCGCALRAARELFALLPIERVIVNAMTKLLNTQTGHMEDRVILSVVIPRTTLRGLHLGRTDPSDSMGNFVYRMDFRKTKGFSAVEALTPQDLQAI